MTPQRCRECRARLGLSLQGMADVLGTDTRLIRRWESGQRPVPAKIAAWLEVAADVPLPEPSWFERADAASVEG